MEAELLAFEIGTGIKTEEPRMPRGIESDTEIARTFEGVGEGAVVGAIYVVGSEAVFLDTDWEDEVGTGDDALEGLLVVIVAEDEFGDGPTTCIVDQHSPIVCCPCA